MNYSLTIYTEPEMDDKNSYIDVTVAKGSK